VVFSLDLNEPSVLIERRPGLKEFQNFQTKGIETVKAGNAKIEVSLKLDDLSCLAG